MSNGSPVADNPLDVFESLDPETRRILLLAGVAAFFSAYGGSVLFYALPAVSQDFHARLHAIADLGSVLALGSIVALPLAALADRRGRRLVIVVGLLGCCLADVASAFTTTLAQLTATRFVAVCFEELVLAVATVLVVESVPREHRALGNTAIAIASGLGLAATTFGYPLAAPHWRLVYLPAVLGIPAAFVVWKLLPEGRLWADLHVPHLPVRALTTPPWRRRVVLLAASALLGAVLYEPVGLLGAFFASRSLHLSPAVISAVVAVSSPLSGAGFLLGGWLSDRFGRRFLGITLAVTAAVTDAFTFAGGVAPYWIGGIVSSVAAGAISPLLSAWTGELLPTRGRATGEMFAAAAAGAGAALGLQFFAQLAPAYGFSGAAYAAMGVAVAGALLLAFLPETRAAPLAE